MVKIKQIAAREEKGSFAVGNVIVCEVFLTNEVSATSTVLLESLHENNLNAQISSSVIIENIKNTISPFLEGKIIDIIECDILLEEMYKADLSSLVPRSVIHAISVALAQAQSIAEEIQLFELFADLSQNETITIPYPFFQISDNQVLDKSFPFQKIFLLPLGASSFRHSLGSFEIIEAALKEHTLFSAGCSVENVFENIGRMLTESKLNDVFVLGAQGNAEMLHDDKKGNYKWLKESKTTEELLSLYKIFIEKYGLFSLQNGFAVDDILGARTLLEIFGDRVQLIANQSLAVDDMPALEALKNHANACIVRPDDYITVTKALTHVIQIRSENINTIIAPRFAANPSFCVDFAVGTSAGQIKTFNDNQKLTTALFERLLDIEDTMTFSLL